MACAANQPGPDRVYGSCDLDIFEAVVDDFIEEILVDGICLADKKWINVTKNRLASAVLRISAEGKRNRSRLKPLAKAALEKNEVQSLWHREYQDRELQQEGHVNCCCRQSGRSGQKRRPTTRDNVYPIRCSDKRWGWMPLSPSASQCAKLLMLKSTGREGIMEVGAIIGVGLAKNGFQLHGAAGTVLFRKKLSHHPTVSSSINGLNSGEGSLPVPLPPPPTPDGQSGHARTSEVHSRVVRRGGAR